MIGLQLRDAESAAHVERACFDRGLLVLGAGDSAVRLSPPLVVDEARVDRALELLADVLS